MTTPINSNAPLNIPNTNTTTSTTNTQSGSTNVQDTISTAPLKQLLSAFNISLEAPSMIKIAELLNSTRSASIAQQYDQQQSNALELKAFYQSNITDAVTIFKHLTSTLLLPIQVNLLYNSVDPQIATANDSITQNITNSSSTDSSNITTMNTAISTYNAALAAYIAAGKPSSGTAFNTYQAAANTYNAAITTYQSYVDSRQSNINAANLAISTFNGNISNYNSQIDSLNAELVDAVPQLIADLNSVSPSSYNLPTAPSQAPTPPSVPSTQSSLSIPTVPSSIPSLTPTAIALSNEISAAINTLFLNFINALAGVLTPLQLMGNMQDFIQYFLQANNPSIGLPPSYLNPQLGQTTSGDNGGISSAASTASSVAALDNPLISQILDNSIYFSVANNLEQPLNLTQLTQMRQLALILITQSGLFAGFPSIKNILETNRVGATVQTVPLNISLATSFGNQMAMAVQMADIKDAILGVISGGSTRDLNELNGSAEKLAAGLHLFLLESALAVIAQVTSNPQLPTQVASTLTNAPLLQSSLASSQQTTPSDALNNPYSVASLKHDLLTQSTLTNDQRTNTILSSVIDQAAKNSAVTTEQLQSSIQSALIQNGYTNQQAIDAANRASAFLHAEMSGGYLLDTAINSQTLNINALNNALAAQNINQSLASAGNEVAALLGGQQPVSYRTVRDALATKLAQGGLTPNEALSVATSAVIGNTPRTPPFSPFSLNTLTENIKTKVTELLTAQLGKKVASDMANELASTVLSLRDQMDAQINRLNQTKDQTVADEINDKLRSFLKSSVSLYTFNQQLLDPASLYSKLLFSEVSHGHAHAHYPKAQQTIDINV